MGSLKCPKCKSANVSLWNDSANMKTKYKTSVNLNPLHPFTLTNTKEVKKGKKSAGKVMLNVMTGGVSGMIIGTEKPHNEYHCNACGHVWMK